MVRCVVRDPQKTVSFLASPQTLHGLAAACAGDPATLADLLLALEPYAPGVPTAVMHGLLLFDSHHASSTGYAGQVRRAEHGLASDTFEVVDAATERRAYMADSDGIAVFDLPAHSIHMDLSTLEIPGTRGILVLPGEPGQPIREAAYTLGETWSVERLDAGELREASSA